MKRLLVNMLALSILVSGAAWSWDDHAEAITGHNVSAASYAKTALDLDLSTAADIEEHDHYCCHGNVHLTGLFSSLSVFPHDWAHGVDRFAPRALHGQSLSPLYKPPRA